MSKKIIGIVLLIAGMHIAGYSQVYSTRAGFIGFYSKTAMEDIKAENNQAFVKVDAGKKNLAFAVLLKGFIFPKELMQEHFNENYVESDKYPKSTFSGAFTGDLNPGKDGVYKVVVKGNLNLHNTTRAIEIPATFEVKGGKLQGQAEFKVKPEDFNISIPSIVRDKIDKEILVKVRIDCSTN
jgi:polyisoprenoid-binding protein YceI